MMDPDDSDDGIAQAAPVWAVFGDLMSGLLGVFVLILMGVLVAQMDLSATLAADTVTQSNGKTSEKRTRSLRANGWSWCVTSTI